MYNNRTCLLVFRESFKRNNTMLSVLLCLCVLYATWTLYLRNSSSPNRPPYLRGIYPIIGHGLLLLDGPTASFRLIMNVSRDCMKKGGVICGSLGFHRYYGETWKNQRRMLAPAFSLPILHGYLGVFNSQARVLVETLSTQSDAMFNPLPYVKNVILKTICMTVFGVDELDDKNLIKQYMKATDTMLSRLLERFHNPFLYSDFMFKLLGYKKREEKLLRALSNMSDTIINKKRAALKSAESRIYDCTNSKALKYKSLLESLLELSENNVLTYKEIKEQVDTFIVAGYDTCSVVLTYILMCLGTYPGVQERLYEEIQTVFGDTDRDVEKTDLSQLVYTEAVIKETLRVYPSGPVILRYCDTEVQLRNYKIPADTHLFLSAYGMNRDPVWGPDADHFRPDRWLDLKPEQSAAFGSFSIGKRLCPGQNFALISLKTMVAHVIRHYRIRANIHEVKFRVDLIMVPMSDCNLVLERRSNVIMQAV